MSFLVEILASAYPPDALNKFTGGSDFGLDNARAMMWMSQLAYETASESKVKNIIEKLSMTKRGFAMNDPVTGLPPKSACLVAAGGRNATIIAFAGTDPLKIEDWITDFTVGFPQPDVLHEGFHAAVGTVWPTVKAIIQSRPPPEQPLFFTGHSLGGALAINAAARAQSELGVTATAVYTFGSPRTGGSSSRPTMRRSPNARSASSMETTSWPMCHPGSADCSVTWAARWYAPATAYLMRTRPCRPARKTGKT